MKSLLTIVSAILLISGCKKNSDPEAALREFIDYRFSSKQSFEGILERTTGKLFGRLSEMSTEDQEKFLKSDQIHKGKLRVNHRNCQPTVCYLTYTLGYKQGTSDKKDFAIEVKKIAEVVKMDNDSWKISDINNVKTYIESKENIEVSE